MSRDIYASLSGASTTWRHLEVISNNVANVSTTGFKEQRLRFENVMVGQGVLADGYVRPEEGATNFADGRIEQTNVPTQLALRGRGFFAVEGDKGEPTLARAGDFTLDRDGFLVTSGGERVLGENGPIFVPPGKSFTVSAEGEVAVDGSVRDRLLLLDADDLEPIGATRWRAAGPTRPAAARVVQGALEGSNADPIRGMTELVQTSRYFELYQKAMQTSDDMDARNVRIVESRR